jgi:hypothetical protein
MNLRLYYPVTVKASHNLLRGEVYAFLMMMMMMMMIMVMYLLIVPSELNG